MRIAPPVGGTRVGPLAPAIAFAVGSTGGAALFGALLGGLGLVAAAAQPDSIPVMWAVIGGVCALSVGRILLGGEAKGPSRCWLIPLTWSLLPPLVFPALFGAILGAGFLTVINFIGYHVIVGAAIATASPRDALILFGMFGFTRAMSVLILSGCMYEQSRHPDIRPPTAWVQALVARYSTALLKSRWTQIVPLGAVAIHAFSTAIH
jgi:hypothetical protein